MRIRAAAAFAESGNMLLRTVSDPADQRDTRSAPIDLLAQRPLRAIVSLAAPTTAVMLIAALSNVLHTYFVSRLGADAIAAVSLVFPIALIMMTVVSGGLGAGVASGVARALGAGRADDARAVAEHAFAIAALLSIAGTAATELGGRVLFHAMGGQGAVLEQATLFARVLFGGLLITVSVGTFDSILRGAGNVRIPALCSTLSLVLQIALTPLFMFVGGLGLIGAPLATLTGQFIGLVPRVAYVFGGRGHFRPHIVPRRFSAAHLGEILRVGVPASLSALLNYVALVVLTSTVARYGTHYLAGYGLGTRLDFVLFSLGFGVAAAALTLVGMAGGAGRRDLVVRYVVRSSLLATGVVAIPAMLVTWRPALWLGLFTTDADIQAVGTRYFRWVGPSYLFMVISMVVASAFQGLGRATAPLTVMIARVLLVVTAALVAARVLAMPADAVFAVIAGGNVCACLALIALFRSGFRRE
jgi:putative MATE family efflux protein